MQTTMRVGSRSVLQSPVGARPTHEPLFDAAARDYGRRRCAVCACGSLVRSSRLCLRGGEKSHEARKGVLRGWGGGRRYRSHGFLMGQFGSAKTKTQGPTRREQGEVRRRTVSSAEGGEGWGGGNGRYGGDERNTDLEGGGFPESVERRQHQFEWPEDSQRPRICILGGGFGGLYTALRLHALLWLPEKRPQIVLVDRSDRFLFKPMLYELLIRETFTWEIAPRFEELLQNTDIVFVRGTVRSVSPSDGPDDQGDDGGSNRRWGGKATGKEEGGGGGGRVLLSDGMEIAYDWLVTALGAVTPVSSVPGAKDLVYPFSTLEEAERVEAKLQDLEKNRGGVESPQRGRGAGATPIRVLVVGAGFAGVELASTVAERLGDKGHVEVVAPSMDICPNGKPGSRECARRALVQRRVGLKLGYYVRELTRTAAAASAGGGGGAVRGHGGGGEPDPSSSSSSSGVIVRIEPVRQSVSPDLKDPKSLELETDLVLWTGGIEATVPALSGNSKAAEAGRMEPLAFPVNARGQIDTDGCLRVRDHPRVFALGDTAGAVEDDGSPLRATAQVAIQQSDFVAWNLWAAINDRPLLPFRYQHLGEIMTLGSKDASVSMPYLDDLTIDGLLGQTARRLVYLNQFPTTVQKLKVGLSWLSRAAIDVVGDFLQPNNS